MEVFKIIFFHELKTHFKSRSRIFANILYFFIFSAIFQILSQNFDQNSHSQLFIINTIIALLTSIIAVNNDFLEKDFRDGSLEQIIIDCQNLEIFVIAKCLANWLSSSFFIALLAVLIYIYRNACDRVFTYIWCGTILYPHFLHHLGSNFLIFINGRPMLVSTESCGYGGYRQTKSNSICYIFHSEKYVQKRYIRLPGDTWYVDKK